MLDWKNWDISQLMAPAGCLGCEATEPGPLCRSCLRRLEPIPARGCRRCRNPAVHAHAGECGWCRRLDLLPAHLCCLYPYRETGRDLFHLVKYGGYWRLLRPMLEHGAASILRAVPPDEYRCLVPIPESFTRKWKRAFNPARLIADSLALLTGLPVVEALTLKPFRSHQVGLTFRERRKNVRGRFRLRDVTLPRALILVDDVLTTGATLQEASTVLARSGVEKVAWFTLLRTL